MEWEIDIGQIRNVSLIWNEVCIADKIEPLHSLHTGFFFFFDVMLLSHARIFFLIHLLFVCLLDRIQDYFYYFLITNFTLLLL